LEKAKCDPDQKITFLGKRKSFLKVQKRYPKLIWLTYREGFTELINRQTNKPHTTDIGWGCAIRSGQMMLAQVIQELFSLTARYPKTEAVQ
jgi:hypothetical protein